MIKKTQCRSIYKVIHDNLSGKVDYFTSCFLKKCRKNPNVTPFISLRNELRP